MSPTLSRAPTTQASPARPRQISGPARPGQIKWSGPAASIGRNASRPGVSQRPLGEGARKSKIRPGAIGNPGGSPDRARKALNAETIAELHRAFRIGGRQAINKVMRNQPAVFLKLLVLLVPWEMKVEHSRRVKEMTTEQIERSIEIIKGMSAEREAGANAKVVEGVAPPR